MRDIFPGYYEPSEGDLCDWWSQGIFVLDANILRNLYRYSEKTRDKSLVPLNSLSDRLWIPHQVAWEYQRHRMDVMENEINAYKPFLSALEAPFDELKTPKKHPLHK
jgi:hypothetical protein